MKSIFVTIIALFFTVSLAGAQTTPSSTKTTTTKTKDYVTMKDGKLMENNGGTWSTVTTAFTCSDGSKVSTDGTVTMANGTTKKLNEGDKVSKDGKCWPKSGMKPKTGSTTPQ